MCAHTCGDELESAVDRTVARLNIEHYRRQLLTEKDEVKRQTLMRLLTEEGEKVLKLSNQPRDKKNLG